MQKKNVLFITCEFYWGGAQKSFLKVVDAIAAKHQCYIAVFDAGDATEYKGVPIYSLDSQKKSSKLGRLFSRVNNLKRLKRKLGITHAISFMEGADNLNILSRGKERVITSIRASIQHNEEYGDSFSNRIRKKAVMPFLYKRSDCVVTVSKDIKQEMVRHFHLKEEKVVPIYNFYDIEAYDRLKTEPVEQAMVEIFENFPTIIGVGRLNKQKNFLGLVRIFALVKREKTDSKLIIIGTGEEHDQLLAECKSAGLSCYSYQQGESDSYRDVDVILLGYRENPHKYVARATLFVLPSKWEGFPNALAEAMLVGAPVVAANCPTGPSEILEDNKHGILLPVPVSGQQFNQWKETIVRLLDDREGLKDWGTKAYSRMKDFTRERIIPEWFKIIE